MSKVELAFRPACQAAVEAVQCGQFSVSAQASGLGLSAATKTEPCKGDPPDRCLARPFRAYNQ